MSVFKRREIPVLITAFTGFLMVLEYFFEIPLATQISTGVREWASLIAAFAVGLGATNLGIIHASRVRHRRENWYLSAWLLFVMGLMIIVGIFGTTKHPVYDFLFANVYSTVGPTMWGLLAFYLASASFRALRVRNLESLLLLVSAILLMLLSAPIGGLIPGVTNVANWVQNVPNTAGMRGILLGTALGAIGLSIRTLLGYEKGYLPE
jgi:uncharacterized membrane protein